MEKKYSISEELKERTYNFALKVLKLAELLPNTEEGRLVRRQIIKAGTSVGANLEVDIVFKEAKETRYWQRIIINRKLIPEVKVLPLLQECLEIIKILSSTIYRLLKKQK